MRQPIIKPPSRSTGLHNYLKSDFTFYWDKEPYTVPAGETVKMPEWLATHGAVKLAEEYFHVHPTNAKSKDEKVRGFYSRHDDAFKDKVKEALIYSDEKAPPQSDIAHEVESMNEKEDKKGIELPEVEDEVTVGCSDCKATGPRHKPTCKKFKEHPSDEAQKRKLKERAD